MSNKKKYTEPTFGAAFETTMMVTLLAIVLGGIVFLGIYGGMYLFQHHLKTAIVLASILATFFVVVNGVYWVPRILNRPTAMEKILYETESKNEQQQ